MGLVTEEQAGTPMAVHSGNGKNAPWNLYKVKPEAREAWEEFQFALDETRTPCYRNSDAYDGYDDPRYEDERKPDHPMPTPVQAAALCADCPVRMLCGRFAYMEKPDFGVWGGMVFLSGRALK
jgi:hypothetical protein